MTDTPALTRYHHLSITVCDVDKSVAWYQDVLGFQFAFTEEHPDGSGLAHVLMRPDTYLFLGIHQHNDNASEAFGEHRTGMDHIGIAVENREDLDRWAEHLDRHSVRRSDPVDGKIGDTPYAVLNFRDPDNIALELIWMP
jgi:glyoxylase I family protein